MNVIRVKRVNGDVVGSQWVKCDQGDVTPILSVYSWRFVVAGQSVAVNCLILCFIWLGKLMYVIGVKRVNGMELGIKGLSVTRVTSPLFCLYIAGGLLLRGSRPVRSTAVVVAISILWPHVRDGCSQTSVYGVFELYEQTLSSRWWVVDLFSRPLWAK